MYYHGTLKSSVAPYANANKYTFWVYPINRGIGNKWDTNISASVYCNNHTYDKKEFNLDQYICLGHTLIEDMAVAQHEWTKMGWDTNVYNISLSKPIEVQKNVNEILDDMKNFITDSEEYKKLNISMQKLYKQRYHVKKDMRDNRPFIGESYFVLNNVIDAFEEQKKDYDTKIDELRAENTKLRAEFKEILTALVVKKPPHEEIAELQNRIMKLYETTKATPPN